VIKVPWFNLFTKSAVVEIEGVHPLVVPSSAVKFDELVSMFNASFFVTDDEV
jgi:hypothetical protein